MPHWEPWARLVTVHDVTPHANFSKDRLQDTQMMLFSGKSHM